MVNSDTLLTQCKSISRLVSCSLVALASLGFAPVHAESGAACDSAATVTQIADGSYVRAGVHAAPFEGEHLANVGFVVGESCVAVIDTGGSLKEGEALNCAIKKLTTLPVCYVILTHHHFDHVMGTLAFTQGDKDTAPQVIAHEKMNAALLQSSEYYRTELAESPDTPLPENHVVSPTQVVAQGDTLELDLGSRTLAISALPAAHTNNDLSVLDMKTSILWLSDVLFVEHVPALDSGLGSINGWLEQLEHLATVAATQAVPGHGPAVVDWPQGANDTVRYLTTVRDDVRQIIADNGNIKQAQAKAAQGEAPRWEQFDFHHQRTVIRAFTELEWE